MRDAWWPRTEFASKIPSRQARKGVGQASRLSPVLLFNLRQARRLSYTRAVPILAYILTAVAAYLLGSIPTGFLVARAKGIDIRAVGSGNIGATNAMRTLGKLAGIVVLLMDAAKGFIACCFGVFVAGYLAHQHYGMHSIGDSNTDEIAFNSLANFPIIAGVFAILGHIYPCWLKFKGGKGIATSAGVYLAVAPWPMLIGLGVFFLVLLLTRYVSVSSMAAAVALTAAVWILPPHNLLLGIVTTALGVLAIYKHRSNIQRLIAGTESRLGKKAACEDASTFRGGAAAEDGRSAHQNESGATK
jgi:acyl phosphate:glycerol-3-phosphate acyltransferase